jgi:hypothetical protein
VTGYKDGFKRGTNYCHRARMTAYNPLGALGVAETQAALCARRAHDVVIAERTQVTYLAFGRRVEPGTWYCRYCSAVLLLPRQLPATPIRVLTVKQPWAAATRFGKRIENRTWQLPQGFLWLHAGARSGWDTTARHHRLLAPAWLARSGPAFPMNRDTTVIPFGAVTALIRVTGSHHDANCPGDLPCDGWAARDQVHNEFDVVAVLPEPLKVDGQQGLWKMPPALESAGRAQVAGRKP